ncbi:hypothetical protein Ga0123462_1617 [Mariprofundus ferrinatatus]|uniref:Mut7-C RNAse domain-containing protein n=1 Tax=Mariprofundus ferrinatatus TaxID=1921087 RepID=A0A2K8L582_9PROT|nr:DUF5615 family PIN-like protein [Mariprofundus ferrinatatus]ATX82475.1 hypothetical protein Ga0123462_1617 [Mariprofundus ferrinatatus]
MNRFLCDEMMVRLGKWLRAAGYDTEIAGAGSNDSDLLEAAIVESRILLTRDRKFLERTGASGVVVLLSGNDLQGWIVQLSRLLGLNWLHAPFSRCLLCNGVLEAGPGPYLDRVPDYVVREHIPCYHCGRCAKPYWEGGHVERMRRRLILFQTICDV